MLTIRLEGSPAEVDQATQTLRDIFNVLEQSRDYSNRVKSPLIRRYLKVEPRSTLSQLLDVSSPGWTETVTSHPLSSQVADELPTNIKPWQPGDPMPNLTNLGFQPQRVDDPNHPANQALTAYQSAQPQSQPRVDFAELMPIMAGYYYDEFSNYDSIPAYLKVGDQFKPIDHIDWHTEGTVWIGGTFDVGVISDDYYHEVKPHQMLYLPLDADARKYQLDHDEPETKL